MEDIKKLKGVRCLLDATPQELEKAVEALRKSNQPEMLIVRLTPDAPHYVAIVPKQHMIPEIENWIFVDEVTTQADLAYATVRASTVRPFILRVLRKFTVLGESISTVATETPPSQPSMDELLTPLTGEISEQFAAPFDRDVQPEPEPIRDEQRFLMEHTPASIAEMLDREVIGQKDLTRAAADFLYYHMLRQLHPELPQRPLLIAGPSGSGKTEVWRVIQKHFGVRIPIRIVDSSNLTCEGWSGNYKLETFIDGRLAEGGILVVDEFDKLTSPKYSSGGNNVSHDIQSEFLKLMEGEYQLTRNKKLTGQTSKRMGLVMVGAFERLRKDPEGEESGTAAPIGFCSEQTEKPQEQKHLTDEDFIGYGIMPEIVGRIAVKCETSYLTDEMYMDIICSPHSRVAVLKGVLQSCGVDVEQVLSREELSKLIRTSRSNRTGVRWVAAQVETRLLESIRDKGLFRKPLDPKAPKREPIPA